MVNGVAIANPTLSMKIRPWKGRAQGHVTRYKVLHPMKYLRNG